MDVLGVTIACTVRARRAAVHRTVLAVHQWGKAWAAHRASPSRAARAGDAHRLQGGCERRVVASGIGGGAAVACHLTT
eukprot:5806257-Prymnesium_polylepis.4